MLKKNSIHLPLNFHLKLKFQNALTLFYLIPFCYTGCTQLKKDMAKSTVSDVQIKNIYYIARKLPRGTRLIEWIGNIINLKKEDF